MKVYFLLISVAGVLFLGLPAQTFCDEPEWKLQVDLVDGSRIVGIPENKSLKVDVGFNELEIPLERIRHAEWKEDRKTVRVEMTNRDIFTGVVIAEPIKMATLFGDLVLNMKHVNRLAVVPTNLLGWLPSHRGLIVYFSFDCEEGDKIVNLADDRHHGKASGVRWLSQGRRGGAVEFHGSGSIEIPNHGDICPATITLAMWVYPMSTTSGYEMLAAKMDSSWYNGYGFVRNSSEVERLQFFVNSYSSSAAKVKVPRNQWSHLAGVFDGRHVSVYLNGDQADEFAIRLPARRSAPAPDPFGGGGTEEPAADVESAPMAGAIKHSTSSLWIGRNNSGYSWTGKMDEFVLYGRALSGKEIVRLYEAGRVDG